MGIHCAKAKDHYIKHGRKEKTQLIACSKPRPRSRPKLAGGFDCRCYLNRYADLRRAFGNNCAKAKDHYIKHGRKEKRNYKCSKPRPRPRPKLPGGFDCRCYLNRYADLRRAFGNNCAKAKDHYIKHGRKEKRNYKCSKPRPRPRPKLPGGFDCRCYLNRYADLRRAFGNNCAKAKDHYIKHGRKEKRNYKCSKPRPRSRPKLPGGFDCRCYLNRYADLRRAFGNNCAKAKDHYIKHGRKEKRNYKCSKPRPRPRPKLPGGFDCRCYLNRYADLRRAFGNNCAKAKIITSNTVEKKNAITNAPSHMPCQGRGGIRSFWRNLRNPIETEEECKQLAKSEGIKFLGSYEYGLKYPKGCWHYPGSRGHQSWRCLQQDRCKQAH